MSIDVLGGCQVRQQQVVIPGVGPLTICSLLDRNQFYDPERQAERLGISPAWWPVFGLLWPSSLYLAAALAERVVDTAERILEMGCGLALPSLVCHRLGMNVTVTDHHPLVPLFLEKNLTLNALSAALPYRYAHWGEAPPGIELVAESERLCGRYDFLYGSDLLYERTTPAALSRFIERHSKPLADVWIVDANRGYRSAFNRQMAAIGFVLYEDIRLNRSPCLSGARRYKGQLLKYRRC